MYFYLLDTFLQNKKYEKEIARIETRITDLGIGGQVARLNILKDINELVHDAVKRGITTVVAIGDDYTIGKVVDVVARYDVVLGIIPLGEQLAIAKILGIPQGEAACEGLSRRVIEYLDLGIANGFFFIGGIETSHTDVVLESPDGYRVVPLPNARRVIVANIISSQDMLQQPHCSHPQDGVVELTVLGKRKKQSFSMKKQKNTMIIDPQEYDDTSIIPLSRMTLEAAPGASVTVLVDGKRVIKPPVEISVAPEKLKVIVGKERVI